MSTRQRMREIALAAVIGLPIWWIGWQLLDGLKGALL
jgi:hypothetical protein